MGSSPAVSLRPLNRRLQAPRNDDSKEGLEGTSKGGPLQPRASLDPIAGDSASPRAGIVPPWGRSVVTQVFGGCDQKLKHRAVGSHQTLPQNAHEVWLQKCIVRRMNDPGAESELLFQLALAPP